MRQLIANHTIITYAHVNSHWKVHLDRPAQMLDPFKVRVKRFYLCACHSAANEIAVELTAHDKIYSHFKGKRNRTQINLCIFTPASRWWGVSFRSTRTLGKWGATAPSRLMSNITAIEVWWIGDLNDGDVVKYFWASCPWGGCASPGDSRNSQFWTLFLALTSSEGHLFAKA